MPAVAVESTGAGVTLCCFLAHRSVFFSDEFFFPNRDCERGALISKIEHDLEPASSSIPPVTLLCPTSSRRWLGARSGFSDAAVETAPPLHRPVASALVRRCSISPGTCSFVRRVAVVVQLPRSTSYCSFDSMAMLVFAVVLVIDVDHRRELPVLPSLRLDFSGEGDSLASFQLRLCYSDSAEMAPYPCPAGATRIRVWNPGVRHLSRGHGGLPGARCRFVRDQMFDFLQKLKKMEKRAMSPTTVTGIWRKEKEGGDPLSRRRRDRGGGEGRWRRTTTEDRCKIAESEREFTGEE